MNQEVVQLKQRIQVLQGNLIASQQLLTNHKHESRKVQEFMTGLKTITIIIDEPSGVVNIQRHGFSGDVAGLLAVAECLQKVIRTILGQVAPKGDQKV